MKEKIKCRGCHCQQVEDVSITSTRVYTSIIVGSLAVSALCFWAMWHYEMLFEEEDAKVDIYQDESEEVGNPFLSLLSSSYDFKIMSEDEDTEIFEDEEFEARQQAFRNLGRFSRKKKEEEKNQPLGFSYENFQDA